MVDSNKLSRTLSHMLRHKPEQYSVSLTSTGWADLDAVRSGVSHEMGVSVSVSDIKIMMSNSSKDRFELDTDNSRIRALYGHNERLNIEIPETNTNSVPSVLYHGTPKGRMNSITNQGLQPQSRSKVHLTSNKDTAITVGKRHLSQDETTLSIIVVDADALSSDYSISNPSGSTFTVSEVPEQYFKKVETQEVK